MCTRKCCFENISRLGLQLSGDTGNNWIILHLWDATWNPGCPLELTASRPPRLWSCPLLYLFLTHYLPCLPPPISVHFTTSLCFIAASHSFSICTPPFYPSRSFFYFKPNHWRNPMSLCHLCLLSLTITSRLCFPFGVFYTENTNVNDVLLINRIWMKKKRYSDISFLTSILGAKYCDKAPLFAGVQRSAWRGPSWLYLNRKKKEDLITIIQSANPFIFLIFDPHLLLLSFLLNYT